MTAPPHERPVGALLPITGSPSTFPLESIAMSFRKTSLACYLAVHLSDGLGSLLRGGEAHESESLALSV